jgi:hypothetical protein
MFVAGARSGLSEITAAVSDSVTVSGWSAAGAASAKLWIARQILLTAVARSLNFLIGAAPGRLFQISISRVVDQSAASFARAASVPKLSALTTASASFAEACCRR